MLRLLITTVGLVVDRGRGMISLGMVDSWATSGKRDFHVGNKYKFFLTSVVVCPVSEATLVKDLTVFWKYQRLPSILSSLVVWWMAGKNEGPPGCDSVCAVLCMVEKIFS